MIKQAELSRRARTLGVQELHAERDYVLNHVLAALAEHTSQLVFRGGTALSRIYWPDFRLSEDLDFISTSIEGARRVLEQMLPVVRESSGLDLSIEIGLVKEGRQRSLVRWDHQELLIDIAQDRCYLPSESRGLLLPYSDLEERPRMLAVQALPEILGNKWFMLTDRSEPRDLFDLWFGLHVKDVPFEEISRGHAARYGYPPSRVALDMAKDSATLWDVRLGHQLRDLPAFQHIYGAIEDIFNRWDRTRQHD